MLSRCQSMKSVINDVCLCLFFGAKINMQNLGPAYRMDSEIIFSNNWSNETIKKNVQRKGRRDSVGLIHHPVHIVIRSIVKGIHHMHTHAYSIPKSQRNEMDVAIFILACMALAITLTLPLPLLAPNYTHRERKKLVVFATLFFHYVSFQVERNIRRLSVFISICECYSCSFLL